LKNYKKKIYVWASDLSDKTGEGVLANIYLNRLKKNYVINIINKPNTNKNTFTHKYFEPYFGIFKLWLKYFSRKETCYLNYLPMWNFLIFLILPPKIKLGPITGGSKKKFDWSIDSLIRNFLFPLFYTLSNIILSLRFESLIFSTSLLKKKLFKNIVKRSLFNFVFLNFKVKKDKIIKKNQFIIYYKKHSNKDYRDLLNISSNNFFKKKKYKFIVVGERIKQKGFINKGYVKREKLNKLLSESKYAYGSKENYYSLFAIDSINNNTPLLFNKLNKQDLIIFSEMYLTIKDLNKKNYKKKITKDTNLFIKTKNSFNNYFLNL
jgi:hypothetical protein